MQAGVCLNILQISFMIWKLANIKLIRSITRNWSIKIMDGLRPANVRRFKTTNRLVACAAYKLEEIEYCRPDPFTALV